MACINDLRNYLPKLKEYKSSKEKIAEQIMYDFDNGMTEREICIKRKLSNGTLSRLKKEFSIKNPHPKIDIAMINRRKILFQKDLSLSEIAKNENVSIQAIHSIRKRYFPEITYRRKYNSKTVTLSQLLEERINSYSVYALVTYPNSPFKEKIWYAYTDNTLKNPYLGKIPRYLLYNIFSEDILVEKEKNGINYFSFDNYLDQLIEFS